VLAFFAFFSKTAAWIGANLFIQSFGENTLSQLETKNSI